MTTEEFQSLTVGGLQRLHKIVNGSLSLSRNKPALRTKLEAAAAGIAFADCAPAAEPEDEDADAAEPKVAVRKTKAKKPAKAKPAKKPKAKVAAKPAGDFDKTSALITVLHKKGKSLREIKAALEAKGLRTARGGKSWWPSSIQSALGQRW